MLMAIRAGVPSLDQAWQRSSASPAIQIVSGSINPSASAIRGWYSTRRSRAHNPNIFDFDAGASASAQAAPTAGRRAVER
jgi:hypothetical protein